MKALRRPLVVLLTLALCVGLFLPIPVSAADLYFTAINERIEYLTSDTMPFWSGGILYVPYTVFDKNLNSTQTDLGITVSYNSRTKSTVTLYNLRQQMLTFDLVSGNCRDELSGEVFPYRAIMRNGKPYLPLEMVCSFFGLSWSYNSLPSIPQGYLVRIMSSDVVLDDFTFINSAGYLLDRRLQATMAELYAAAEVTGYGHAEDEVTFQFELPESVRASVKPGQVIGTATVYLDGYEVGKTDLVARREYVSDFITDSKATLLLLPALLAALLVLSVATVLVGGGQGLFRRRRSGRGRRIRH